MKKKVEEGGGGTVKKKSRMRKRIKQADPGVSSLLKKKKGRAHRRKHLKCATYNSKLKEVKKKGFGGEKRKS